MTTRHFVDRTGAYLGGFAGGAMPTDHDAVEVGVAPEDAQQIWADGLWNWPLSLAKARKTRQLLERYADALAAGMSYAGSVLQIRETDQQNIAAMGQEARWALATAASWPTDFAWRMADNSFLPLPDPGAMIALGEAAKAEVYRLRQVKWGHADAIAIVGSVAEVMSHEIETGW